MSPTRTSRDGTYRLDWRRREIGRITVTSGQTTVTGWRRAMALLDVLYGRDELDVLKALKAGKVTMKELLAAEKAKAFGRGDALQLLALRRPLWPQVEAWTATSDGVTMQRYGDSMRKLKRLAGLKATATLADLGKVDWKALRAHPDFKSNADWNALRRAVSRFLTVELGDVYHPARRAVLAKIERAPVHPRKVELSVNEFWELVKATPDVARPGVVFLAATGLRLGEYERCRPSHLRVDEAGGLTIGVRGSKTDGSTDTISVAPAVAAWVSAAVPMPLKRLWFRRCFKKGAKAIGRPGLRLHDLRHCTAMFALEGGAAISQVRDMMRHEGAGQTLDYTRSGNTKRAADAIAKTLKLA